MATPSEMHPSDVDRAAAWAAVKATGPHAELDVLLAEWATAGLTTSSFDRLSNLARRFAARLEATGVSSLLDAAQDDCEAFLWAPTRRRQAPSIHTVHLRRTALRGLYRALLALEPDHHDPTRTLDLPGKPIDRTRPLRTAELELLRTAVLGRARYALRAATVVALAEATATTGEIPELCWYHLDLTTGAIRLPGASPVNPRCGTLGPWGLGVLRRWHHTVAPDPATPIVPSTRPGGRVFQASMVSLLSHAFSHAGLHDPQIRPGSIRLHTGNEMLQRHGIEAAARALGYDSLDATAAALAYRWQDQA